MMSGMMAGGWVWTLVGVLVIVLLIVVIVKVLRKWLDRADGRCRVMVVGDAKNRIQHEYDWRASDYDRRWRRYVTRSVEETVRRANLAPSARVLDVGCGSGELLNAVVQTRSPGLAAGIDLSLAMTQRANQKLAGSAPVLAGDAEDLPFTREQFDVVVSSSSFHFWPDRKRALLEFRRVLRPGGRIVITDWCDDFIACRICDAALRIWNRDQSRILKSEECGALLVECGFRVVSIDCYKISWIWGLMTAVAIRP
jgi:SAM-dependent methyltransferase